MLCSNLLMFSSLVLFSSRMMSSKRMTPSMRWPRWPWRTRCEQGTGDRCQDLELDLELGSWIVKRSGLIRDEITSFKAAEAERERIAKLELERIKASCKPEEKQVVLHKVQSGDTLSKIARKYYRDFTLWKQIYQANRDQLANPSSLEVGQELVIP